MKSATLEKVNVLDVQREQNVISHETVPEQDQYEFAIPENILNHPLLQVHKALKENIASGKYSKKYILYWCKMTFDRDNNSNAANKKELLDAIEGVYENYTFTASDELLQQLPEKSWVRKSLEQHKLTKFGAKYEITRDPRIPEEIKDTLINIIDTTELQYVGSSNKPTKLENKMPTEQNPQNSIFAVGDKITFLGEEHEIIGFDGDAVLFNNYQKFTAEKLKAILKDEALNNHKKIKKSETSDLFSFSSFTYNGENFKLDQEVIGRFNGVSEKGWKISRCPRSKKSVIELKNITNPSEKIEIPFIEFIDLQKQKIEADIPTSETVIPAQLNIGDTVIWEGEGKKILNIDQEWVTFDSGLVSRLELEDSLHSGTSASAEVLVTGDEEDIYNERFFIINGTKFRLFQSVIFEKNGIPQEGYHISKCPISESDAVEIKNDGDKRGIHAVPLDEFLKMQDTVDIIDASVENNKHEDLNDNTNKENEPEEIETPESIALSEEIARACTAYSSQYTLWKNKNREKKGIFKKIFSDLGIEKQLPESSKPAELIESEKEYIQAKKNRFEYLKNEGKLLEREDVIIECEKNYAAFQKQLLDGLPLIEKGVITKSLERWNKMPWYLRAGVATAAIALATYAFDSVAGPYMGRQVHALSVVGGAGALRFGRSLLSGAVAQPVGKLVDSIQKKNARERNVEKLNAYGVAVDLDSFEEKEKEMMKHFEKEKLIKKRGVLRKMGIMLATGVGVSAITNLVEGFSHSLPTDSHGGTHASNEVVRDHVQKTYLQRNSSVVHENPEQTVTTTPHKSQMEQAQTPLGKPTLSSPESTPVPKPLSVEVSSRGFIKTFDNMKTSLIERYHGVSHVPKQYEHLLKTSSTKLSQEFGLYDAKHNASALGLKGEHLSVDDHGGLHLEKVHGKIVNIDSHDAFVKSGGKMVMPVTEPVASHLPSQSGTIASIDTHTPHNAYQGSSEYTGEVSEAGNISPVEVASDPAMTHPVSASESFSNSQPSEISGISETTPDPVSFHRGVNTGIVEHAQYTHGNMRLGMNTDQTGTNLVVKGIGAQDLDKQIILGQEATFGEKGPKILELSKEFQESPLYSDYRKAFTEIVNKDYPQSKLGDNVEIVSYRGGTISVIQGIGKNPNAVAVLLNGKEIAKGVVENGHSTVQMLDGIPKHQNWFQAKTVYEGAFDEAKSAIKKIEQISVARLKNAIPFKKAA